MKKISIILITLILFAGVVTAQDLDDYPEMFIDDNELDGYIVVGFNAPTSNVVGAVDISASLMYELRKKVDEQGNPIELIGVGTAKLDSEVFGAYKEHNFILVGNSCNNMVTSEIIGNKNDCLNNLKPGEGKIKIIEKYGNYYVLVMGYSAEDTRRATKVLADYDSFDLDDEEVCIYGTFGSPIVTECEGYGLTNGKTLGIDNAPVPLIMFADFQCPYCSKWFLETLPQIKQTYIDTGKVKFIFRHYPLSFHQDAKHAAIAAECAAKQGMFFEYADILFDHQTYLNYEDLSEYADDLNLDLGYFNGCRRDNDAEEMVEMDFEKGTEMGVRGTPSFFINGKKFDGAQSYDAFKKAIDEALGEDTQDSCTEMGYKCTSPVRGCGLDYKQLDYSCPSTTICCEGISYCGDGICDTEIQYPQPENIETCPQDCDNDPKPDFKKELVLDMPFDYNNLKQVYDMSDHGNDGTVNGAKLSDKNSFDGSYVFTFDGTDDYIDVGNDESLTFSRFLTVGAWAKSDAPVKDGYIVTRWGTEHEKRAFILRTWVDVEEPHNDCAGCWIRKSGSQWRAMTCSEDLDLSVWNHFACTYDGANIKLMVNGKVQDKQPFSGSMQPGTYNTIIGSDAHPNPNRFFKGLIDDVIVWNYPLSEQEIKDQLGSYTCQYGYDNGDCVKEPSKPQKCPLVGHRQLEDNTAMYCDIDSVFRLQKIEHSSCQNNFECLSNHCINGDCVDMEKEMEETQSMVTKIFGWFARVFG